MFKFFLVIFALCCAIPAPAWADEQTVAIYVTSDDRDAEFSVFDARVTQTNAGAAVFGVLGTLAESAATNSADAELTDIFRERAAELDVRKRVVDSAIATFEAEENFKVVTDAADADRRLDIRIITWGLTRSEFSSPEMRAYYRFEAKLSDRSGTVVWKDKTKRLGKRRLPGIAQVSEAMFVEEAVQLAEEVGEGIAYEIIFQ